MESGLSKRMQATLEYILPTIAAAAPPAKYNSTNAIDLSNAQNEVLRPELLEFFKRTVENDITSKAFALPSPKDRQLRDALALFFNQYFNPVHAVEAEHIVLTAGASDAIENIIHAICDDGDSIIAPGPAFHGFNPMVKPRPNVNIIVAQPPTYANWDNYLIASLQAVYDFSDEKSRIKAVLLCNPHNPLSRCYPKAALLELMEFCQEHELHLIVDEIYAQTMLNDIPSKAPEFVSALSLTEPLMRTGAMKVDPSRVHVVWSASKLFGLSGLRVGCVISQQNPQLLTALSILTTSHVNNIASIYLSALLTWSQLPTLLKLDSERLTVSYRLLAEFLREWRIDFIAPSHGIFLFARLAKHAKTAEDEKGFYDRLAVHGVRVGQGRFYEGVKGEFGWARIRFSLPVEDLKRALGSIAVFLSRNRC